MKLYTYFESGSAYRIRIALALKGIEYEPIFVVGGRDSTDLQKQDYLELNPAGAVPTLIDGDTVLTQSIAIMEYLEEKFPEPPLLPSEPDARARARAMTQLIVSDTHPLSTARVMEFLDEKLELPQDAQSNWRRHWNERGFMALEELLAADEKAKGFYFGEHPTMADIALVSQVFVATKFGYDISYFPNVMGVYEACMHHPAFKNSAPLLQPDAPKP